jgi:hypothetical protein
MPENEIPGQTKKLVITIDGKLVYVGEPYHYDFYASAGATHLAVQTVPQE